jgi:serine protease Do
MRTTRCAWPAVAALALLIWGQPAVAVAQATSSIGVQVQDVAPGSGAAAGAEVREVVPESPAARAGVQAGDIIEEFDGERVRSASQFARLVRETVPGREVNAVVSRNGQRQTLQITTEQRRAGFDLPEFELRDDLRALQDDRLFEMPLPRLRRGDRTGTTLLPLNEQLAAYFGVKEGVLVSSVAADSAAARAGLKAGDVITAVNGRLVRDPGDVREAMRRRSGANALELQIVRDKRPQSITVPAER